VVVAAGHARMHKYKYRFGSVPSRRLGRSLGVDLTPFKTCTLDCIFCQLGPTTNTTISRAEYAPVWHVESELDAWIKNGGTADHITLAGSGEPTLHSRFGDVLRFARDRSAIPTALLSNGTLFWMPEVREAAKQAHIVKLSLSAWDQFSFVRINRPDPKLKFECVVEGQRAFRDQFPGKLWIEVFLIDGMNTTLPDVEKIAALVKTIGPDEIQLNTAVRPPSEEGVFAVPRSVMESLAGMFTPAAKVIAEFPSEGTADMEANEETILAMLKRRPCTSQQIAAAFGMHPNEVSKYVGRLARMDKIRAQGTGPEAYYVVVEHGET